MALTDIEAVRLKTSDKPTYRRDQTEGDGERTMFHVEHRPVLSTPALKVYVDDVLQVVTTDYTLDATNGIVTFVDTPSVNSKVVFEYYSVVFTDDEVQLFLTEASGDTTLAAALNLFAWAASAAEMARKESAAGGGGFGSVTMDTAVRAKELRAAAQGFIDQYQMFNGTGQSYEGITTFAWTEQTASRMFIQGFERDLF